MGAALRVAHPWETGEIAFESHREYPHPYLDVEVEVEFVGPGGEVIRRPAFWDGSRTWRVRFAPTRPGTWRYRVASTDPTDKGLNGCVGEVVCADEAAAHRFGAHGFLRKGPTGRHLVHADGTPFFWLGDTHWRFAWERWDESNKDGWDSQFRGTVDRRVEQGFTEIGRAHV